MAIRHTKNFFIKAIMIFLIIFVLINSFFQSKKTLFAIRNLETDLHIHYSSQYQYSQALKILKKPNDTLFIIPANMLIYWDSNLLPASKYTYFYPWMEKTDLVNDIKRIFIKNPPIFLYCHDCEKTFVYRYLDNYYQFKKSKKPTHLYVKKNKFNQIKANQIEELKLAAFEIDY